MEPINASQQMLSVAIADAAMLHAAAMPFILGGGVFIPTAESYRLGDEVFVLLRLPGETAATPVAGKVVWVTPKGARRGCPAGIGLQLQEADDALRQRMNDGLAASASVFAEQETYTM